METTLIITANVIFLTWLYVQQKRLAAFERYCMSYYILSQCPQYLETSKRLAESMRQMGETTQQAAESFKAFGESLPKNDKFHAC